ncbi:MAG: trigger factor [Gemmatimonadota bacterium]|nr:trigger factor [Gemmatimonadota bacterium]
MNLEITPKKSEGTERLLAVSVPVEEVIAAEEQAATRYATKVRLPGFRPGKVPAAMVRKRFAEAIRQEAIEALVQGAFKQVVDEQKLRVVGQPHIDNLEFNDGKPLTFELHLEVHPELKLERTTGFRVTRTPRVVNDDSVREQIDQLRDQRAAWSPVTDKPMPGDMVTVNLATADESGAMSDGKEYRVVLGEGQAIPAIEEVIMETAPGETTERKVKWPDDFPDESQRGKTKMVRAAVVDVKRKSLPALDESFAREAGDFDSVDALTKAVRTDLERMAQRETDAEVRQRLVDEIISANPFDVPQVWVQQLIQSYAEAYQIPETEREKFAGEFRSVAERQVRRDLVIETIAEREKLKASEADIDTRVAEVAEKNNSDPGKVYASLQKAGRLAELERSITEDKVYGWLLEKNDVQ